MTMPAPITDSHCHLDFPDFDDDRDDVVARAIDAGVTRMVSICTKLCNEPTVRRIAENYPSVFYAAATHPMNVVEEPTVTVDDLVVLAAHPKFVAIGETGLDYFYTSDSAEMQKTALRVHIEAARQTGLPLIIHSRSADEDMTEILTSEMANGVFGCVMHCFSSTPELARATLDLGCYLSMSGIATFPKSQEVRDIFAATPVDRILVETDAPYLAPPPKRGKRNEPAYTAHTAQVGADIFEMEYADFAAQTQENFDRLFAKVAAYKAPA